MHSLLCHSAVSSIYIVIIMWILEVDLTKYHAAMIQIECVVQSVCVHKERACKKKDKSSSSYGSCLNLDFPRGRPWDQDLLASSLFGKYRGTHRAVGKWHRDGKKTIKNLWLSQTPLCVIRMYSRWENPGKWDKTHASVLFHLRERELKYLYVNSWESLTEGCRMWERRPTPFLLPVRAQPQSLQIQRCRSWRLQVKKNASWEGLRDIGGALTTSEIEFNKEV